jgi:hypothetical protein
VNCYRDPDASCILTIERSSFARALSKSSSLPLHALNCFSMCSRTSRARAASISSGRIPVRWDHNAGGVLEASGNYTRDSLRMINEVRQIRAGAKAGLYDEAVDAARTAKESKHADKRVSTGAKGVSTGSAATG